MSIIPTRTGLDEEHLFEKLPKVIETQRKSLIKSHHYTRAWNWLLREDIVPKFKNMEIVHAYINDYASDLTIHILIDRREDMQPYLDLFANDNNWVAYEEIQADIFDHILAIVNEFDLRLFQQPTASHRFPIHRYIQLLLIDELASVFQGLECLRNMHRYIFLQFRK